MFLNTSRHTKQDRSTCQLPNPRSLATRGPFHPRFTDKKVQARKLLRATQLTSKAQTLILVAPSKALHPHPELPHEESLCPLQFASFSLQHLHRSDYTVTLLLTIDLSPAPLQAHALD